MPGGVSGFNSNGELVVAAEIPIEELSRPPAAASSKQPAAAATKTMTNKKKREEPPNPCPLCEADMNKGCGKVHKCMDTACGRQICCECHVLCDIGASSKCARVVCDECSTYCASCDNVSCLECSVTCAGCEQDFCVRCWDGDTCGVCAKTVCAVCAGSEGDPWDRMRYCGEKGCTAVICTGCCGDHQPVSDFGGNFREALPHLAPIVEIEKAAIENRVADKMIERPYFGKGKQADQLSRIHDTEAIEKFSLLAMGVHSCPNHLHDTTIFVPTRECFYACAGCFTKEGTHDFCPAHLKGHQSKCPLNGTWAHMRIPGVQAIPVWLARSIAVRSMLYSRWRRSKAGANSSIKWSRWWTTVTTRRKLLNVSRR